jgi:hypothetical protein
VRTRVLGTCCALALLGALAGAPTASAVTPVTCAGLAGAVNSAGAGDVLQLPPGPCLTNLTVASNTNAFTLEGATTGGATQLEPANPALAILTATADVRFTLTGLTFTGTTAASALLLTGNGEAATIVGNTFTADASPASLGAAIQIHTAGTATATQPTVISGNTFAANDADLGGAVAVLSSGLPVTLSGNTFTGNSSSLAGGALYVVEPVGTTAALQISDNRFGGPGAGDGNASEGPGGAALLQLASGQRVTISGNTFQGNAVAGTQTATGATQRWGGALYLALDPDDAAFTVQQSHNVFSGNQIAETEAPSSTPVLTGGGAEWIVGGTVVSTDDQFVGNRVAIGDGATPEGGAVGALASNPLNPPVEPGVFAGTNDLFSGNSVVAGGWGGAIYVGGAPLYCTTAPCQPSTAAIADSTVIDNSVAAGTGSEGGAIWGSPQDHLTLHNSIVAGNSPAPELFGFGSGAPAIAYSDVCGETGGTAVPATAHNICENPKLTGTAAETSISPTIDAGSNGLVPAGLTTDIAGNQREIASRLTCSGAGPATADMGAFEYTQPLPAPPCAPPPPPKVAIGKGPLHDKHGHTSVKLTCPSLVLFCKGTVTISTRGRHSSKLGRHRFKLAGGKTSKVTIKLSKVAFGKKRSIPVVVNVTAQDNSGATAKSHRKLQLRKG